MNLQLAFFVLFAVMAVGSAFYAVMGTRNVVRAVFALMGTFGGVAGLFGLLGADFLVAAQLVVYVGGVLVLLLFGVMLSKRPTQAELTGSETTLPGKIFVGVMVVCLALAGKIVIFDTPWNTAELSAPESTTRTLGELFLSKFLLPFEFISLLLLGALVGAVLLARKEIRGE